LKSGSFTLLEPSGPVQACNGIALPFAFTIIAEYVEQYVNYNEMMEQNIFTKLKPSDMVEELC
jgi:hypothetical protein